MAAAKRSFTRTEFAAGAMVLASAAILILFVAVIRGLRPPEKVNTFQAHFTNTGGLNVGGDVRFGGVKAGRIVDIGPDPANQARVEVTFALQPEFPLNAASRAYITQTTLTAEPHLEVTTGAPDAAVLMHGAVVPEAEGKGGGLFAGLDAIAASLTPLLADARTVLGVQALEQVAADSQDAPGLVTVASVLADVDETIVEGGDLVRDVRGMVAQNTRNVETILARIQEIEDAAKTLITELNATIEENRPAIKETVGDVRRVAADVAAVTGKLSELEQTLAQILGNAEAVSGEAQQFVEQNRPTIEDILLDLRETVRQLKLFARTVAEEPEAVIRGRSPHGRR